MSSPSRIARAGAEDLDAAAGTLAAAFESYAWTRWSIPADDYAVRLERLQRLYLGHALEHGIVLIGGIGAGDVNGVIAVLPPSAPAPSDDLQTQVAELHGARLAVVAAADTPPFPDGVWNLATLGVRPEAQGHGLGAALIGAALAEVDASRVTADTALETSDDRNVRLYERAGFTLTATTRIQDGPTVYTMLREAVTARQ
ncbi:MAG: GNAT family N-acetyltransferase [Mycobacterium sp.]|nr:GNAT family N-acetyltransferase [Mycobacterium sp.]